MIKFDGKLLKQARDEAGFTLEELSMRVSVSKQTLSKYELNETSPGVGVLATLAVVLNKPIGFFLVQNVCAINNDAA